MCKPKNEEHKGNNNNGDMSGATLSDQFKACPTLKRKIDEMKRQEAFMNNQYQEVKKQFEALKESPTSAVDVDQ